MQAPVRIAATALVALVASCGGDHAGHDHAADHSAGTGTTSSAHGHVHVAPRGGLLVVLAEETAHVELLFDSRTGRLDAYLLGPHASHPRKSAQKALRIELDGGDEPLVLDLKPIANALSGDAVGSTSHFGVQDARLVGRASLSGRLVSVEVLGRRYQDVPFGPGT